MEPAGEIASPSGVVSHPPGFTPGNKQQESREISGASGTPVGALRSTHSQTPGGDGPLPQLWQAGGRVLSGVGALTGRRRNSVSGRRRAGRSGAV